MSQPIPIRYIVITWRKLKIYNNGYSTIKHDITLETKEETKFQLSASGGIKISGKGDIKKFKGSIDANIKASVSYTNTKLSKETYKFKIVVDPMTYVKIVTRGKGIINNGRREGRFPDRVGSRL